jgi:hypothetical protein
MSAPGVILIKSTALIDLKPTSYENNEPTNKSVALNSPNMGILRHPIQAKAVASELWDLINPNRQEEVLLTTKQ